MATSSQETSPSLAEFVRECRAFLGSNASRRATEHTDWGQGSDELSVFGESAAGRDEPSFRAARTWRAKRFDSNLGWITGPNEYGGRELTPEHERVYAELETQFDVPTQSFFVIGLGMVAPTILAHGTSTARDALLAPMHRGDIIGCQLFSEPGAGSDLASLQCHARRDGDDWIISGQKVWTSGAHLADVGEILCRTDRDAPKHLGLTAFVIDMRAKGVEVRPLRQMTGSSSFNEVFLDDVRVSDDYRLGAVGDGWNVALTTLANERATVGVDTLERGGIQRVVQPTYLANMMRHFGMERDAVRRQQVARIYSRFQVAEWTNQRAIARIEAGENPGPELSGAKLALSQNLVELSEMAAGVLGPALTADTGMWGALPWSYFLLDARGLRIGGGTDEIQRNIIGERVLGLPKEPHP